jgi:hypothetical protein
MSDNTLTALNEVKAKLASQQPEAAALLGVITETIESTHSTDPFGVLVGISESLDKLPNKSDALGHVQTVVDTFINSRLSSNLGVGDSPDVDLAVKRNAHEYAQRMAVPGRDEITEEMADGIATQICGGKRPTDEEQEAADKIVDELFKRRTRISNTTRN